VEWFRWLGLTWPHPVPLSLSLSLSVSVVRPVRGGVTPLLPRGLRGNHEDEPGVRLLVYARQPAGDGAADGGADPGHGPLHPVPGQRVADLQLRPVSLLPVLLRPGLPAQRHRKVHGQSRL